MLRIKVLIKVRFLKEVKFVLIKVIYVNEGHNKRFLFGYIRASELKFHCLD